MAQRKTEPRGYWLWVTRPEYYADYDGSDRADLDPEYQDDSGGWWTCHRNTERGDLVLLWRTAPRSDIGYLIEAMSDAYSIADEEGAVEHGWDFGCEYQVLYKLKTPVTVADLRAEPHVDEWGALRGRFQRRVFAIPPDIWSTLVEMITARNPDSRRVFESLNKRRIPVQVVREQEIEEYLAGNLAVLAKYGYDLGLVDRQVVCAGYGGRIDILCYDRRRKRHVVIELKNVRAGRNTFGQVTSYMGWVTEHFGSKSRPALGVVIARGADPALQAAMLTTKDVQFLDLADLGYA